MSQHKDRIDALSDRMQDLTPVIVDVMGGDVGPKPIIEGVFEACRGNNLSVVLVGNKETIDQTLRGLNGKHPLNCVSIEPSQESISMGESKFSIARKNKESSIVKCLEMLKQGKAQAVVSAGSTAATVYWAIQILGAYPETGMMPALPVNWPHSKGFTILIDSGATPQADALTLAHFAILGRLYAQIHLKKPKPRIGLLSIGEERTKGNSVIREAHRLITQQIPEGFVGMVEGKDLAQGKVDVVVCDGFIGNIALKLGEGVVSELANMLRNNLTTIGKIGALLMWPTLKAMKQKISWESYGGVPLLGVNGNVFIAHGRSTPLAISNAIKNAALAATNDLVQKIKSSYPSPKATPTYTGV